MTMPQPSQWEPEPALPPDLLDDLRASLLETLRQHEARLDTDVDPDDIAALVQHRSERARTEILDALARLDDGTYGSCGRCGEAIPPVRLTAVPHARHCTSCARIDDGRWAGR